jgi:hypothetical protein
MMARLNLPRSGLLEQKNIPICKELFQDGYM